MPAKCVVTRCAGLGAWWGVPVLAGGGVGAGAVECVSHIGLAWVPTTGYLSWDLGHVQTSVMCRLEWSGLLV
jgi:hypothetical protein